MIVVCDTSPISNLAIVGQLDLLSKLYGSALVPPAVYVELAALPDESARTAIQQSGWLHAEPVQNTSLAESLVGELDVGEAQAIALAIESRADLLLIDERLGRQVASRFGLRFVGVLGVLIDAKQHGFIPAVGPVMEDLRQKAGFWIRDELRQAVLQAAGET